MDGAEFCVRLCASDELQIHDPEQEVSNGDTLRYMLT